MASFFKVPCLDFRAPNEATVASDSTTSGRLSPVMNTAAATLVWSQIGRPQHDDECSSQLLLGLIPVASDSTWRG
jgi:hypothetical protein